MKGFIGIRHTARPSYRPEEVELAQALAHQAMFALQLNEFADQSRHAAVLEERNRMARDIHDTLAQGLTGVIVQLQAADDATAKGYKKDAVHHLQSARDLARAGLNEARRSVRALRPQALEDATFWDALQTVIKNAIAGTDLHAEFQCHGKTRELSPLVQENLLHIGQEALTNTLRYAHARNFKTRLTYKAKELRLELRDDGDGFKVKDRHDAVGRGKRPVLTNGRRIERQCRAARQRHCGLRHQGWWRRSISRRDGPRVGEIKASEKWATSLLIKALQD